jgi:hypothetical protein
MITALQLFEYTIAVVIGIMTPAVSLIIIRAVSDAWVNFSEGFKWRAERAAKQPPFTKIVLRRCPNDRMLSVRIYKGDTLIWDQGADMP